MSSPLDRAIAVTGMSGRFPGAGGVEELWRILDEQRDTVSDYTEAELLGAGAAPELVRHPDHVASGAHLAGIGLFDAGFFGFTTHEADSTDPQQRILLEVCHEALERAGHAPGTFRGRVGVCAGRRPSDYDALPGGVAYRGDRSGIAEAPDDLAQRIARSLGCTGPALTLRTGSTSLAAVHLACRHLLDGVCDMALAGGVALRLPQHTGYLHREGGPLTPTGRCRPFDADGDGLIFGDGAAAVVLRRLSDALADGDPVLAVIRGSAMHHDGDRRAAPAAPGLDGPARVVREAMAAAGLEATDLSYVEAHAAGVPPADRAEVRALTEAFATGRRGFCALGSVKANVGHLDTAAGLTGLIKTVLAIQHRRIPGTPHFRRPHPELDLVNGPFHIAAESMPWSPDSGRRIAGVNALGDTPVHVVLEEPPEVPHDPSPVPRQHLFVWSAHSAEALEAATVDLRRFLEDNADAEPADVAFTLYSGRRAYRHRRAVLADGCVTAARAIRDRRWLSVPPASLPPALREPATAWLRGAEVDWTPVYAGESRRRLRLPTHPMRRRHHWWPAGAETGRQTP